MRVCYVHLLSLQYLRRLRWFTHLNLVPLLLLESVSKLSVTSLGSFQVTLLVAIEPSSSALINICINISLFFADLNDADR